MLEQHYAPVDAATMLGVDSEQVLAWIHSGELAAANVAKTQNAKRPRWRISESELGKFLLRRRHPASVTTSTPKVARRPKPKQYV
ncbi:Helix-turn-helix domain protein [Novipirellula aureliae]|uniref:Helix-turn-helix domain protein n=1 Tax=Novipirellula aureliae TaxID=2527966 RepID=A0A5C6DR48_9BACT|nr:helix-turn-helix domain-containing protein [Novipirellula aureliae]TWU39122.1 Helix-turn-helix domain protein [Novipirellula aureliae]